MAELSKAEETLADLQVSRQVNWIYTEVFIGKNEEKVYLICQYFECYPPFIIKTCVKKDEKVIAKSLEKLVIRFENSEKLLSYLWRWTPGSNFEVINM